MTGEKTAGGRGGRVLVLVVGDEIVNGSVPDRNGARVAAAVRARGGRVQRIESVGDDGEAIADALHAGLDGDGIIVTGGLGPTSDDVTREAVATALGRVLVSDRDWAERVTRRHPVARGLPGMDRQARIPEGARPVDNPTGTALGFFVPAADAAWVLVLPGVPSELAAMLEAEAGAILDERLAGSREPGVRVAIAGVPESVIAERLQDVPEVRNVRVASYPRRGTVDLLLRPVPDREGAPSVRSLERAVAALRQSFGRDLYEVGERSLPETVLAALRERGETLTVAESCTGGGLGSAITSVAGASDVFWGGVIAYANEAKRRLLGVAADVLEREGAVSEPVALAMARGMRERAGADWGVSITGIAGPSGGSAEKPVGTVWIAVAGEAGDTARCLRLPGGREEVRDRSVSAALDLLRRRMIDAE